MEEEKLSLLLFCFFFFKSNSILNKKDFSFFIFFLNGQCLFTFCVLIVSRW